MSDLKKYRNLAEEIVSMADSDYSTISIGDFIDSNDTSYVLSTKFVEDQKEMGASNPDMLWNRQIGGPRQEYLVNKNRFERQVREIKSNPKFAEFLKEADKSELAAFDDAISDRLSLKLNLRMSLSPTWMSHSISEREIEVLDFQKEKSTSASFDF